MGQERQSLGNAEMKRIKRPNREWDCLSPSLSSRLIDRDLMRNRLATTESAEFAVTELAERGAIARFKDGK